MYIYVDSIVRGVTWPKGMPPWFERSCVSSRLLRLRGLSRLSQVLRQQLPVGAAGDLRREAMVQNGTHVVQIAMCLFGPALSGLGGPIGLQEELGSLPTPDKAKAHVRILLKEVLELPCTGTKHGWRMFASILHYGI